ncbi:MAG: response regulator [Rhodospirillaceae bacterium]|nr:response regulator [Rhodospirillaceae bacterium]MBT4939045.1 response regulator [Rhodospirillaceae bacterium]MBT7267770.1 response regulator [Rhodospirillaceae bacterium]
MVKIQKYMLVLLVFAIGVAASVVGFRQFVLIEETEKEHNFHLAATERLVAIERSIQSNLDSVLSIKSFFESNLAVKRDQFKSFVLPVLKRNSALKALEWIPMVTASERAKYENAAKSEGFKGFKFVERTKSKKMISAKLREDYFPVYFVEPYKKNEGAFGFDLGSSEARRVVLEAARDSGQVATSESITLVQNGRAGVLLFAPIYKPDSKTQTVELRRQNIAGFALGVVEIQNMITVAYSARSNLLTPGGIDFYVYDDDKIVGDPFIYAHQSRKRSGVPAPKLSKREAQIGLHVSDTVEIGDRNWLVIGRPLEPKFGAGIPKSAWGVLLLGLILSATIAYLVKSNIDRNRVVEELVIERTSELLAKTEQIELMHDVTVIANEAATIEAATQTCVDLICERAKWQVGHAYYVAPDKSAALISTDIWYLEDAEKFGQFKEISMQADFDTNVGLPWNVLIKKEPFWISGNNPAKKTLRRIEGEKLGLKSVIGLPVMIGKDVVAILEFFYIGDFEPDETLMQSLTHIGTQIGRVFERKKIESMKNEFISTVSHELRTPLTSIKGSLGLIVSGVTGTLSDGVKDMVNIAYNNSDRLVRLINDILDIEKIEVGKMEFNMEVLELAPLMTRIVAENEGFAKSNKVTLKLNNFSPQTKILADSDRITQAVTNLISNAAKFSPENGHVEIDVTSGDHEVHIAVSDKGPGIPEGFRSKIFGKFAQADSVSGQGGTGLGLNISKAIVEEHRGQIGFESETDIGTTFYIDLAKYREMGTETSSPIESHSEAPRVLVCEDDPDIAKLLELILSKDGVSVDVVYNAADAKQALLDATYDAMTLDLALPDQDGISLLQEIRQFEETRDLPIVVVSAKAIEGKNELNGHAFGIVDWIQKPIDHDYLNATLLRAIQSGAKNKPRVLHIEDDPDVALIVSTLIADIATVTLAKSFSEGKALLASETFDLVILDLMLPDGAGEDLLTLAQGLAEEEPTFIVFSAKEVELSSFSNHIKASLVKSRTSNEKLVSTVRAAIES